MPDLQEQYDDAMLDFSMAEYDLAIEKLKQILEQDPQHFDAQLALGMAYYRKGDFPTAITEGHKAEKLRPDEQLVHTNLSLFYMRSGDKDTAEQHGLKARVAGWKENMAAPAQGATEGDPELQLSKPKPPPMKTTVKVPDMPWKKKPKIGEGGANPGSNDSSPSQ